MKQPNKAQKMAISLCMMLLIFVPSFTFVKANDLDLVVATEEMQRANYFTFATLINMSPLDPRLEANVTFLMPKDKKLAAMPRGSVLDFLLRHSIPSPFLYEDLEKFPTGTTIPSSLINYTLRITNIGSRDVFVNNVKIVSPNICVAGFSIRCHGIEGILLEDDHVLVRNSSSIVPTSSCSNGTEASPSSCVASPSPPTFTAPAPIEANSGSQNSLGYSDGSLSSHFVVATLMSIFLSIYF